MRSSEFFSEFNFMRLDMAAWQYDKHPGRYRGIDFRARAHGHFLLLDGLWRDVSDDVLNVLSVNEATGRKEFEELRLAELRSNQDKSIKWSLNRLRWTEDRNQLHDPASFSALPDPWFKFRAREIERSFFLHPRTAGPVKKKARLESSSVFAAMHVALCALEAAGDNTELAVLSRAALTRRQSA